MSGLARRFWTYGNFALAEHTLRQLDQRAADHPVVGVSYPINPQIILLTGYEYYLRGHAALRCQTDV